MNLLPLSDQGIFIQTVGVIAAGECAEPADVRFPYPQAASIAPGPYHFLDKSGHQFAMLAQNPSPVVDNKVGVPHGAHLLVDHRQLSWLLTV